MKVGILTYHCVPNFGAQMQTISTVGYLKRKGLEPIVINWFPNDLENMYKKRVPADQFNEHIKFAQAKMPLSALCHTEQDILRELKSLDIKTVFAGSDAIFKYIPEACRNNFTPLSVEKIDNNAFWGGFLENSGLKAVAFSASAQNTQFQKMTTVEKKRLQSKLINYSKISVRDEWSKKMIEYITQREDISITPDPVFAFNSNVLVDIPAKEQILRKYNIPDNYVLLSFWHNFLPATYIDQLNRLLKKEGYNPVALPVPECLNSFNIEHTIPLPLSPLDWYALIKHSSGYIGERMHPIVVAIHNCIPFYSFDEYGIFTNHLWGFFREWKRNTSKTYNLLKKSDLLENYYSYLNPHTKIPDAETVVKQITQFATQKCRLFKESQEEEYNSAMEIMLEELCS